MSSLYRLLTPRVNYAVLGSGTSANTALGYIDSLPFSKSFQRNFDAKIAIVGGQGDVWSRFHSDFLMGQSGALYKSDVADHKPADANRFMKVGDYREQQRQALEKTVKQHHTVFVPGRALKLQKYGRHDFLVTTTEGCSSPRTIS